MATGRTARRLTVGALRRRQAVPSPTPDPTHREEHDTRDYSLVASDATSILRFASFASPPATRHRCSSFRTLAACGAQRPRRGASATGAPSRSRWSSPFAARSRIPASISIVARDETARATKARRLASASPGYAALTTHESSSGSGCREPRLRMLASASHPALLRRARPSRKLEWLRRRIER
jgi:hypothetical protein